MWHLSKAKLKITGEAGIWEQIRSHLAPLATAGQVRGKPEGSL